MSKKSKYTVEEKFEIIMEYDRGICTRKELLEKYKIGDYSLYDWKYKYERYGIAGLENSKTCKKYPQEVKVNAIKDYLSGEFSQAEITRKYELSTKTLLRKWLKKYNGHKEIKKTAKGLSHLMTKGRSTSFKERVEIVLYCINHDYDYHNAAKIHQVSYQQVYQWVKKYESDGEDALRDRRGRKKDDKELTAEEKIKIEIKRLEKENERLRAENAFLKKLEELERRRY